jgi:hypothetical protein
MNGCYYLMLTAQRKRAAANRRHRAKRRAMCLAGREMIPCRTPVEGRGPTCPLFQIRELQQVPMISSDASEEG